MDVRLVVMKLRATDDLGLADEFQNQPRMSRTCWKRLKKTLLIRNRAKKVAQAKSDLQGYVQGFASMTNHMAEEQKTFKEVMNVDAGLYDQEHEDVVAISQKDKDVENAIKASEFLGNLLKARVFVNKFKATSDVKQADAVRATGRDEG